MSGVPSQVKTAVSPPAPPPKLQFDDGIRNSTYITANTLHYAEHPNPRLSMCTPTTDSTPHLLRNDDATAAAAAVATTTSIYDYYEIERLVNEIRTLQLNDSIAVRVASIIRIAIQLPDELLMDAMDVCSEYEMALFSSSNSTSNSVHCQQYDIYVLGDTTYASCCPDMIAAQHINAHILVHYGHACLSSITTTTTSQSTSTTNHNNKTHLQQSPPPVQYPIVLYSFGKQPISIEQCVHDVTQELHNLSHNDNVTAFGSAESSCSTLKRNVLNQQLQQQQQQQHRFNILLLYEVQYAHAMNDLRLLLLKSTGAATRAADTTTNNYKNINLSIKLGRIPQQQQISPPQELDTCDINVHNPSSMTEEDTATTTGTVDGRSSCCGTQSTGSDYCIDKSTMSTTMVGNCCSHRQHTTELTNDEYVDNSQTKSYPIGILKEQYHHIMVGGLELPYPFSCSSSSSPIITNAKAAAYNFDGDDEWTYDESMPSGNNEYILLYIGHVTSRPFLNIALRFLSSSNSTTTGVSTTTRDGNNNNSTQQRQLPFKLSSIWTWSPPLPTAAAADQHIDETQNIRLCTNVLLNSKRFQKILQRRYYLIQKAKQCTTFGIIVAHMTPNIQEFVTSIQHFLDHHQRRGGQQDNFIDLSYFTFVVGKINPTKLANFPEIDCFILVACPEHTLLQNERELYPIPIITPYELLVAFGSSNNNNSNDKNDSREWGDSPYSTYTNDYWDMASSVTDLRLTHRNATNEMIDIQSKDNNDKDGDDDDDDDDVPYFSLVTGRYEAQTTSVVAFSHTTSTANMSSNKSNKDLDNERNDVKTLSNRTDGTIVQYGEHNSKNYNAAADFFIRREYQGLVMMTPYANHEQQPDDDDEKNRNNSTNIVVQPAILGRTGIASNYSNR